ncbi:hypothetical protein [Salinactinospora qingdaonensis]|uniref:Uncharacterized protein n=1 Tax=Salinactinospora qingdaonensis TaxID=702744 RepID=A0ABP7EVR7_9ACTN
MSTSDEKRIVVPGCIISFSLGLIVLLSIVQELTCPGPAEVRAGAEYNEAWCAGSSGDAVKTGHRGGGPGAGK